MKYFSSSGQTIKTGMLLGRGAKGDVYGVEGRANLAAKIYREPLSARMAEKLRLMGTFGSQRLLNFTAWPVDTLLDRPGGVVTGFLMPNFSGYKPIHQLTGVKSRLAFYPNASWPFLIHAAANTARTFSLAHEHDHVIGDVSSTNVMVSAKALVALIDCDNFQLITETESYLCEGGTTGYVPSELIGSDFGKVIRTQDHDAFGLAVLIFQLLFMGRHPFSGNFQGRGEKDLDQSIKERRFAYGAGAESRQMAPPPGALPFDAVSAPVAGLFERAFLSSKRPRPLEWVEALDKLSKSVKRCDYHNGHYYLDTLPACPWCLLERVSGVRMFNFVVTKTEQTQRAFHLEDVWARINTVRPPGPAPEVGELQSAVYKPSLEAFELGKKIRRRKMLAISLTMLGTAVTLLLGLPLWIKFAALAALFLLISFLTRQTAATGSGTTSLADSADPTIRNLFERKLEAERVAGHYEQRWQEEASDARFTAMLEELKEKKTEYITLPALQQKKLHDLEKVSRERQLPQYLDGFRIGNARVEDLGPDKKITLQSNGFETAADIKRETLARVPGLGQSLIYRLVSWRQSLEQQFVFNPSQSVTQADRYAVDQEIYSIRLKLEQELIEGETHLRQCVQEITATRELLQGKLVEARQAFRQASAELHLATETNFTLAILVSGAATALIVELMQYWPR